MVYSGAWGKLIHEKNQKSKISWHCPFNVILFLELLLSFSKTAAGAPIFLGTTLNMHNGALRPPFTMHSSFAAIPCNKAAFLQ